MPEWFTQFDQRLWMSGRRKADPRVEADFIRKALRLRKGQRLLDAPCGFGRIALPLAQCGILITGVDQSANFIRRARNSFRKEQLAGHSLSGEFHAGDLRQLDFENEFDAAINWFGSFGYFSDEENLLVLKRLANALKPGGRLLVEQPNRAWVLRNLKTRLRIEFDKITIHNRWDRSTSRMESRWVIRDEQGESTSRASMRLYTPGEFKKLLAAVGMKITARYGSYDASEYSPTTKRLIIVAEKLLF